MTFAAVHWVASALRLQALSLAGRRWLAADALALGSLVVLVGAARVYLGYHTLEQVLAGVGCGTAAALSWLQLEVGLVKPHAARIAGCRLGRLLAWRAPEAEARTKQL